jgi:hypothetical protein
LAHAAMVDEFSTLDNSLPLPPARRMSAQRR